jgi:hypothetical protein
LIKRGQGGFLGRFPPTPVAINARSKSRAFAHGIHGKKPKKGLKIKGIEIKGVFFAFG